MAFKFSLEWAMPEAGDGFDTVPDAEMLSALDTALSQYRRLELEVATFPRKSQGRLFMSRVATAEYLVMYELHSELRYRGYHLKPLPDAN